jgi:restriction endonuclease S subunit
MTLGNFSKIRLPIPSIEYQREAVDALVSQMAATDAIQARIKALKAAHGLFLARETS